MIRCESSSELAEPVWILIPQREHASLAWQLARHWSGQSHWPGETTHIVLAAIQHHDDGWRSWDAAPGVDPISGRPLNFTEMPLPESLSIWTASIEACERWGPLAQWMVAGHFAALLAASSSGTAAAARRWLAEIRSQRPRWLDAWREGSRREQRLELAAEALASLQFFDALSLRLCHALEDSSDWQGAAVGELPRLTPDPRQPNILQALPWSWLVSRLELVAEAYELATRPPLAGGTVSLEKCRPRQLRWTLQAANL